MSRDGWAKATVLADRGVIRLDGAEARDFLQGLVSNDVRRVGPERAIYAALLSPQGKFLFDFIIMEHEGALLLDTEAARLADLVRRLTMYKLRAKVTVADASGQFAVAAAFGPAALASLGFEATAEAGGCVPAAPTAGLAGDARACCAAANGRRAAPSAAESGSPASSWTAGAVLMVVLLLAAPGAAVARGAKTPADEEAVVRVSPPPPPPALPAGAAAAPTFAWPGRSDCGSIFSCL